MTSQYGQDRLALELLGGMRGGFFLDSGAADGVTASNTLLLERVYGWRGICIEPNERFYADLVRNRRCHCVNCCLYDREGDVEFVEADTLSGILAEYHPSLLRYATSMYADAPTVSKPTRTLRSVLRECGAPPVIDYWSLDTEGSELAILESFPFDEYDFRILTVEHNWLPVRTEIRAFLEGHGYHLAQEIGCDDCYVHGRIARRPAWRSAAWRSTRR